MCGMKTILVVDDTAVFREPIAAMLRTHGFVALTAGDGAQALDQLRQHGVDLVLLDVAMPVTNGLDFLEAIRAEPVYAHLLVVLLTAMTENECVARAAQHGVRDCLLKSRFSLDDLIDRVNRHLHGPAR